MRLNDKLMINKKNLKESINLNKEIKELKNEISELKLLLKNHLEK